MVLAGPDGEPVEHRFRACFRLLSKTELSAIAESVQSRAAAAMQELDAAQGALEASLGAIAQPTAGDIEAAEAAAAARAGLRARVTAAVAAVTSLETSEQRALLERAWTGWSGIRDGEGEDAPEVPYSDAVRAQLLDLQPFHAAVWAAWQRAVSPEARAKN